MSQEATESPVTTYDPPGQVHQDIGRVEGKIDIILTHVDSTRQDLRELSNRLRHLEETSVRHDRLRVVEGRIATLEKTGAKVVGITFGVTMVVSFLINLAYKFYDQLFPSGG